MTYTLIPGQSDTTSEEETLSMIRSVLTEQVEDTPKRKRGSTLGRTLSTAQRAFVERTTNPAPRRRASDLPDLAEPDAPVETKRRRQSLTQLLLWVTAPIRNFRPTTRHLAIVSMLLLLVVRPHWFVIGAVLTLALVIAPFMMLGADRIWGMVQTRLDRIEARNPDRATQLRNGLDHFACRWDSFLDVFPDGMVDGLYMPDLQAIQDAEEAHEGAVTKRLIRMVQEGQAPS